MEYHLLPENLIVIRNDVGNKKTAVTSSDYFPIEQGKYVSILII